MRVDSSLLIQAMREGVNQGHLPLTDIGMQLGWSGDKTKNIFSGRTRLSSDDVLNILSDQTYQSRTSNGTACSDESGKHYSLRRKVTSERNHRTASRSRLRSGSR